MSILIPGLKMPPTMGIQIIIDCGRVWVKPFGGHPEKLSERAIELPPHGRLIDADAFAENLKNVSIRQGYKDTLIGECLSVDDVIDAIIADLTGKALCGFELNPTIIPADKEETE